MPTFMTLTQALGACYICYKTKRRLPQGSSHHHQFAVAKKGDHDMLAFLRTALSHQHNATWIKQMQSTDLAGNISLCLNRYITPAYKLFTEIWSTTCSCGQLNSQEDDLFSEQI